ncbi:MAG TPA: FliM/FliN family flagellar motor switch protein [Albidovulum sp.]|uniref:FliM/FliN family flagellar motor switch protein n=1 Tax=Albidovulum sp. TaxID=1872424 RepID=UPI002BB4D759|nr:FliM/FliN family flagellar motor switch protein [Albidovulum sp.]
MADTAILRRMAQASGDAAEDPARRVLATSVARAAEAVLGLPLAVDLVDVSAVTLADLPERLEDRALLALIEAPGERQGLAILSAGLVSAVIEVLTTGRMTPSEPAPRRPTRTDAALSVGLIEGILAETDAAAMAGDAPWAEWQGAFRYASSIEDPRLLPLILDDTRYHMIRCGLRLGLSGDRAASLSFVLPERRQPVSTALKSGEAQGWRDDLAGAVLGAEAEIIAVLARLQRPLAEVAALKPGSVLRLPDDALTHLRLEGAGRQLLARARLGQYRGYLAVRLTGAPSHDAGAAGFTPAQVPGGEPGIPARQAAGA